MPDNSSPSIAIIGMGLRFPSAPHPEAFWDLLKQGREGLRPAPSDRFKNQSLPRAGYLEDIAGFDWKSFGIPPKEASRLDPQQRLLLEVTREALDDAGMPASQLSGSRTGVFVGISWNDFLHLQNEQDLDGYAAPGNLFTFASNRISHHLGLQGPSLSIDAACASSLATLHLACQSLMTGESDLALSGGVELILGSKSNTILNSMQVLSEDGTCRPFDHRAAGFIRGEGAGILVLKRAADVTSADRVYAWIRSCAINYNGNTPWILNPNPSAHAQVMTRAYEMAGISPEQIQYVELHGNAIKQGDLCEARALAQVHQQERLAPLKFGSVKSNIGSLGAAAGVASVTKVALSLFKQQIPPMLHLNKLNGDLPLDSERFEPATSASDWLADQDTTLAAVHGTSLSGTNVHLVLEGHTPASAEPEQAKLRLFPISAHSEKALREHCHALNEDLARNGIRLEDLAFTLSVGRDHFRFRTYFQAASKEALHAKLQAFLKDDAQAPEATLAKKPVKMPLLRMVFPELWDNNHPIKTIHPKDPAFLELVKSFDKQTGAAIRPLLGQKPTEQRCLVLYRFLCYWHLGQAYRRACKSPIYFTGCGTSMILGAILNREVTPGVGLQILCGMLRKRTRVTRLTWLNQELPTFADHTAAMQPAEPGTNPLTFDLWVPPYTSSAQGKGCVAVDPESPEFLDTLASIYHQGFDLHWAAVTDSARICSLTPYPWQREYCWPKWLDQPAPEVARKHRATTPSDFEPEQAIAEKLGSHLGLVPDEMDPLASFADLGMNSLMAIELTNYLNDIYQIQMPAIVLYEHANIRTLAAHIKLLVPHLANDEPQDSTMEPTPLESRILEKMRAIETLIGEL